MTTGSQLVSLSGTKRHHDCRRKTFVGEARNRLGPSQATSTTANVQRCADNPQPQSKTADAWGEVDAWDEWLADHLPFAASHWFADLRGPTPNRADCWGQFPEVQNWLKKNQGGGYIDGAGPGDNAARKARLEDFQKSIIAAFQAITREKWGSVKEWEVWYRRYRPDFEVPK